MTDTSGWSQAEMYVMKELARLGRGMDRIEIGLADLRADVRTLRTGDKRHAMIFGLIGGGIMSFVGGVILTVVLR